jgi:class 3 adenylate cyclase/pimeloyl-ACP methyl ester carboxylesterase
VAQYPVGWVRHGARHIAYQVIGEGPPDLVFLGTWAGNLDRDWDDPSTSGYFRRLAASCRLVRLDRSGTGLSDRVLPASDVALEQWCEEIIAVLDAVGSETASIWAEGWSGPLGMFLAARYPSRFERLVLTNTYAKLEESDDHPCGVPHDVISAGRALLLDDWGNGATLDLLGLPHDDAARRRYAEYERSAITRGDLASLIEIFLALDVRDVLHRVELPTLVLHEDNHLVSEDQARYLAKSIASSRLQILSDRYFWRLAEDDYPAGIDIALEFLTGVAFERDLNRELLTIVFLDIVESTRHVETLGDRRWTMLLEQFDNLVHTQLQRYRGEYVNSTGDGLLAVFRSPTRALHWSLAMLSGVQHLGMELRAGVHTGECQRVDEDVRGVAVHVAARLVDVAKPSQVLLTRSARDLIGGHPSVEPCGVHELEGTSGEWLLYSATPSVEVA